MRAKEFIVETAEEIRELESLSGMIADKVMPIFSKSQRDYARIIKLKYLNLPQFKSPAVNDIIANASISMYRWWPGDTLGSWHIIEQNVTMRKDMLDNRNEFVSTLAHELTHALDAYKGLPRQYSKMTTKSKATAGDEYENYLRLQYEIDARLTQALLEIGSNIKELQDIDQLFSAPGEPTPKEQQVLSNAISWAFGKHQIAQLFPQGARDPKYRRLLTRAYKFYSTPAVAPQATEPTLVQRAKNWIGLNVLAEDANPARQAAKAIWNKKHHKKPKGVAEGMSWSALDEGLSVEDKIIIFEEYMTKGNLTKSLDHDKRDYFISLFKMSSTPIKDKTYIVVPLSLVGNKIMQLDAPAIMKFVGHGHDGLVFNSPNGEKTYPSKIMRDLSVFNTFTFQSQSSYDKFRTALSLKFNVSLPLVGQGKQGVAEGEMNFEEGDCPVFAIALHRLSKLPLMALVEYDEQMGSAVLIHAYVKLNNKWRIDATGEIDVDWMLQKYPNNGNAEEIEISEKDLIKLGYGKNKCPMLQQVLPHAKEVLQTIDNEQGVAEGTDPDKKYTIKKSYTMSKAGVEKAVWYIMDGDFVVDVTDLRRDAKYYADKWNAAEKESSNASQNLHKPDVAESDLDRFKKYIRPVVKTTPKIEKTTNPAGRTTDYVEWIVTSDTGEKRRFDRKKQAQEFYDLCTKKSVTEGL